MENLLANEESLDDKLSKVTIKDDEETLSTKKREWKDQNRRAEHYPNPLCYRRAEHSKDEEKKSNQQG